MSTNKNIKLLALKYSLLIFSISLIFLLLKLKWNNLFFDFLIIISISIVSFFLILFELQKYNKFFTTDPNNNEQSQNENIELDNLAEWTEKTNKEIAELKANEKFRKEFIGNVAHELKTPIFNIQGFVSTLLDGALNDPKVNVKYLERTDKNVLRLITLVKDLDTISKLETGKIKPDYNIFDIHELIEEVFEILEVKALEYGVNLISNSQSEQLVYADKEKITEVIHNLVLNSIIYGKKNGFTEVNIQEEESQKKYVIIVKDNGIGIEPAHLSHIFERFYRVDRSRSRERGGSGLGLSIVKHIIDSHNQTLRVKSQIDIGTSFIFTLDKI